MRHSPYIPMPAVITEIRTETADVSTFTIALKDRESRQAYRFEPGQYNMISLPGIGEAPISISSSPRLRGSFEHTVRFAGRLTTALSRLATGDTIGVRGPYGRPWPVKRLEGRDVAVIVGGTGCACIKPAINLLVDERKSFRSAVVLYGSKTADELLFVGEFDSWRERGVDVHLTVDRGNEEEWPFHTGVVTTLFDRLDKPAPGSVALISGPDIMMRFCVLDLLGRGWRAENIWLSLERRMECAIKMCGHCQLGPKYVCQDGPVFSYAEVEKFFGAVA